MNNIIFNEIDKIEIYFDNGEYVTLNNNNIKSFDLITNENTIKSFKIKIVDNGDIDFHFALINRFKSPIERLQNKDIYKTNIIYKNGNNEEFETPCEIYKNNEDEDDFGYSSIQDYSCNQHSKLISYKEIELYIAENSREYTLEEALEELKDGDIIIDSNGNEYEICEDNITGEKYLNTILKQSLLKEVFTKKNVINNETSNIKNNKHYCSKCNKPLGKNITYNKLLEDKNEYLIANRCLFCKTLNMYTIKQPLKDNI